MTTETRRTARSKALASALAHLHDRLGLAFGFTLWDGTQVPLGGGGLRVVIRDPRVLTSLIRRPRLDTLVDAWVSGGLDLTGGTLFDLADNRPTAKGRALRRSLDKTLLLKAALPFVFGGGAPRTLRAVTRAEASDGRPDTNQANVAYHYDVSNAFYRLFLDERMVYSCGYFRDWEGDLDQAQADKLDMICRKLRLQPGERFLDIGCGWGALAIHAAAHYGVEAEGVTLSERQLALARERVAARGLESRVHLHLADFSTLTGSYDKIASIGMFEHVRRADQDAYLETVRRLLRPRGLYLHHAIVRPGKRSDAAFRRKRSEYRAILRYVFPGAELDHIGATVGKLEAHSFEVHDVEAWREHYARTTRLWAERLHARQDEAAAEAGEAITRLWLAYLTGVSLGFSRGSIGIFQTLASKRAKGPAGLPPTREDLYRG